MRSASWSSTAGSVGAAALSCDHSFSSTSSTAKSAEEVGVWLRDVGGLLACRDGGVSLRGDASSPDERSTTSPPSLSASGLARRSSALGGPLEGWRVASNGLGPLPRIKEGRPGPWLWQGGQWGAAAAEGGPPSQPARGYPRRP